MVKLFYFWWYIFRNFWVIIFCGNYFSNFILIGQVRKFLKIFFLNFFLYFFLDCLFGTIKVPRGSCFFNKTKEEVENNQNNSTCNLNEESKGVYKLCEQNSNFKPIFLDASFEYCSPSQNIKATDLNGQIINTQIEEFKQTSFECNYSDVSFVLL